MRSSPILITRSQWAQLLANGWRTPPAATLELQPVVRLFQPEGVTSWLLVLIDPRHNDRVFALCDAGDGLPELGFISVSGLSALGRRHLGQRVERDCHFRPNGSLATYAAAARLTPSNRS